MFSRFLSGIDLRKFIRAFAFLFTLDLGFSVGNTLLTSLLLTHYGAKIMPLMTVGLGILELMAAFLSAAWAKSKRKTDALNSIFIVLAALIGCVYISLYFQVTFLLPAAFIALGGLMGIAYIQTDVIITHLFPPEELDKAYPRLTIAFSLSNIIAGLLLGALIGFIGNHQAFLMPLLILLSALWMSARLYRFYPALLSHGGEALAFRLKQALIDTPASRAPAKKTPAFRLQELKNFAGSLRSLKSNAFLRYFIILAILSAIGTQFFSFGFNTAATQRFSGDDLTRFLAFFNVAISSCTLLFRLFALNSVLKYLSFSRINLFNGLLSFAGIAVLGLFFAGDYPATYLAASVMYIVIYLGFLARGLANNSLYRLIPEKERDNARTLTEGIGESVSVIISALIVAIFVTILPVKAVIQIALVPALIYCFFAFSLARVVYRAIGRMLKSKNESEVTDAVEILAERRGRELMNPLLAIYPDADAELKKKIIHTLGEIRDGAARRFLHDAVFHEPLDFRKSLLRALGKFKGNHSYLLMYLIQQQAPASVLRECLYALVPDRRKIIALISKDFLLSTDPQIKTEAMIILDELKDASPRNMTTIDAYAAPGNPLAVVKQALRILYHRAPKKRPWVQERVSQLAAAGACKEEILTGLELIGELLIKPFEHFLFQKIDNESDHEIKSAALKALSVVHPEIAIDYFSYYLSSQQADSPFYALAFSRLSADLQQEIARTIIRNPVAAIDQAIKNLTPFWRHTQSAVEMLHAAIPQKFQAAS